MVRSQNSPSVGSEIVADLSLGKLRINGTQDGQPLIKAVDLPLRHLIFRLSKRSAFSLSLALQDSVGFCHSEQLFPLFVQIWIRLHGPESFHNSPRQNRQGHITH